MQLQFIKAIFSSVKKCTCNVVKNAAFLPSANLAYVRCMWVLMYLDQCRMCCIVLGPGGSPGEPPQGEPGAGEPGAGGPPGLSYF